MWTPGRAASPRHGIGLALGGSSISTRALSRSSRIVLGVFVLGFLYQLFSSSTTGVALGFVDLDQVLSRSSWVPELGWSGFLDQALLTKAARASSSRSSKVYSRSSNLDSQIDSTGSAASLTLDFCSCFPSFSDLL